MLVMKELRYVMYMYVGVLYMYLAINTKLDCQAPLHEFYYNLNVTLGHTLQYAHWWFIERRKHEVGMSFAVMHIQVPRPPKS